MLDRAGVAGYNGLQGASLMPIIRGDADPHDREAMLIEEEGQRIHLGFSVTSGVRTLMTKQWRMSVYGGAAWGELYNLASDPDEASNLWDDPANAAVRAQLVEQLMRKSPDLTDISPMPTRVA